MDKEETKKLENDPDGLVNYEYIANHIEMLQPDDMEYLVGNIINVDRTGQFVVSAARYLNAIDAEAFNLSIRKLAEAAIDKDREHRYLPQLIEGLYGNDYRERYHELNDVDDIYRRIYKRLYPTGL